MSFFLPEGKTLQLSSNIGDINHQGILSSNINGTDIQQTFPTTSTGTSTGNYNHLGIDGQNNNKWDFLNISGTLDGGYNFWHSSDAHAPLLITSIDDVGLTVDRSATVYNPSYKTFGVDGSGFDYVFLSTLPEFPPTNWEVYNMYVVRVGNNTATLSTGVDYNVDYRNTKVITFHTTSDPNSPIIDSTGITSVLIPYGGTPVVTTKTAILTSEELIIKNDPSFNSIELTNNGLTVSDVLGNSNTISSNLITVRDPSAFNTQINPYSFIINGNAKTVAINENNMAITDSSNNNSNLSANGLILNSYYNAGVFLNIIDISGTTIQINDNDQGLSSNFSTSQAQFIDGDKTGTISAPYTQHINSTTNTTSILTSSDLTFNNVSLKSAVATNTSNIATNTTNIATNTTNIATNTTNIATNTTNIATNTSNITTLQQNAIQTPIIQLCSPAVYGTSPSLPPQKMFVSSSASNIINIGYGGWYFRNFITGTNIGWNAGFASSTSTVGDLMQLSFSFLTPNTTTSPQCTVYSLPATGGNFFNSRRSYVNTGTPVANTPYLYYINFNGYTGVPFKSGHTSVLMTNTNVSNVGAFAPTETLYFWSVGTNSATTANSVELIVSSMTFKMTNNGSVITQPYSFLNNEVINAQPVLTGSGTIAITPYHYGASFGATNDITVANTYMRAQDALFYITFTNAKTSGAVGITYPASAGNQTYILQSSGTQVSLSWSGTSWSVI